MPDAFGLFPQAPAPSHPLDPSAILGLADQVNKLQLFQKDFQARQATGDAYAAARRPDGSTDPNALVNELTKRSAATNWTAPETARNMVDLQRGQAELSARRQGDFIAALGSLPDHATMDDVNHAAVLAAARGASAVEILPQVERLRKAAATPGGMASVLAQYRNMGIGPAGLAAPVEGPPNPVTGRPTQQTAKQFLQATTPGTGVSPGGPQAKGLGPGEARSPEVMAANDARESNFRSEMFPWEQAVAATKKLKELYPQGGFFAPGAKARQDFESFLYGVSPTLAKWGVDPEKLKEFSKADKYLTQATQQRANDFGVHSDAGLASAIRGQPNTSVNDLAAEELIPASAAVRRAQFIQHMASKEGGGLNYLNASSQWPASNDIRALTFDMLDEDKRKKLLASLKKGTPEYERFNNTLREAYKYGAMDRPGRGNGP
jgi:hypothetical protein